MNVFKGLSELELIFGHKVCARFVLNQPPNEDFLVNCPKCKSAKIKNHREKEIQI